MSEDVLTGTEAPPSEAPAAATEPTPGGGGTPPATPEESAKQTPPAQGKVTGYRVSLPGGGHVDLSPAEYQQRLLNYPNLSQGHGSAQNVNAELKREVEGLKQTLASMKQAAEGAGLPQAQMTKLGDLNVVEFDETDFDDPSIMKSKMGQQNKVIESMRDMLTSFSDLQGNLGKIVGDAVQTEVARERTLMQAESEISSAIANDPQLKAMAVTDAEGARDYVMAAMKSANRVNDSASRNVYNTVDEAIAAYRAVMTGKDPVQPFTNANFVTELRQGVAQPPAPGGGGVSDDVVKEFNAKLTGSGQEAANKYYNSLAPEQRTLIDNAAFSGEV